MQDRAGPSEAGQDRTGEGRGKAGRARAVTVQRADRAEQARQGRALVGIYRIYTLPVTLRETNVLQTPIAVLWCHSHKKLCTKSYLPNDMSRSRAREDTSIPEQNQASLLNY